jgi:hypothetical protein
MMEALTISADDKSAAKRNGSAADAVRGLGVTFGPSLMLDLLAGAGVVTATTLLLRPSKGRRSRLLRPLAALGALAPWGYMLGVRPWHRHWGATEEEVAGPLPGDELIPHPMGETTRAITIEAPAGKIWPWLLQMGQGRGGLYTYDWLENLAGLDIHSVDRIVPELQELKVGDVVPLSKDGGLRVASIEPERALVLQQMNDTGDWSTIDPNGTKPKSWFTWTWAFVLDERSDGTTRLVIRVRSDAHPRWQALPTMHLVELPHFVMERRMLRGIKERAERNGN